MSKEQGVKKEEEIPKLLIESLLFSEQGIL
jgi:hypothetical protein